MQGSLYNYSTYHKKSRQEAVEHFIAKKEVKYENTEILDPTCGSGTALSVAKRLGVRSGLGLDTVPAYVEGVNKRLAASSGS